MPELCSWPHFLRDSGTNFIKSGTNKVKIAQMGNFLKKGREWPFLRHYDVISPDNGILRILKCCNYVPGHISCRLGDQICIKIETNRAKIAQIGNFV